MNCQLYVYQSELYFFKFAVVGMCDVYGRYERVIEDVLNKELLQVFFRSPNYRHSLFFSSKPKN